MTKNNDPVTFYNASVTKNNASVTKNNDPVTFYNASVTKNNASVTFCNAFRDQK